MAGEPNIFSKSLLTPGQLRSVAERRFADARCLLNSGDPQRSNGAIYMAGFVIERLLKALLLERHPNLQKPVDPATLSRSDREIFRMLSSHDLDEMQQFLPEIQPKLLDLKTGKGQSVWKAFRDICEEWSVYARYSTVQAKVEQDERYLDTVDEVRRWLKEL